MKKAAIILLLIVTTLSSAIYLTGLFSSEDYHGERTERYSCSCDSIWMLLEDPIRIASLRSDLDSISVDQSEDGRTIAWIEHTTRGGMVKFEVIRREAPRFISFRLAESSFGLSGQWDYRLTTVDNEENGCELRIEENSKAEKIWVRAMMTLVGRDMNLKMDHRLVDQALKGRSNSD